jgi:hypothetical protein
MKKLRLGSYGFRMEYGAVERPQYAHCVYNAALLGKKLGYPSISVIEFGVAGGSGLVNLEGHAAAASAILGIDIEVYGFDTGTGLPEPVDYRDLPYRFRQGFYRLDEERLRRELKRAVLVLGDVRSTCRDFFEKYRPAPLGAFVMDLDFYSSTVAALSMLDGAEANYLPRIFCYFDDTIGTETELYNEFTGERLAIHEFNRDREHVKLAQPFHLLGKKLVEPWHHQIWICHFFTHSRYNDFVSTAAQELPLRQRM